jgi:hypothetical protein
MGKRGLTPLLKNALIVGSLFITIFIVIIIMYNIVSLGADEKKSEALVKLDIVKNSVVVEGDVLKLSVSGEIGEEDLKKVKFIISDGINEEEINLDASDFVGEKDFRINLRDLGVDSSKKLSVSVSPIIKTFTGEKTLKITDRVLVTPTGEVEEVVVEDIEIISDVTNCDDCGGAFGDDKCSRGKCHSILEGTTKCFYEGSWKRTCTSCEDIFCSKYKNENDCSTDRCGLSCEWSSGSVTGNFILKLFTGKVVGGSCVAKTVTTDTTETCAGDCPACTEGDTQACGTDVGVCAVGEQTCSASNEWGDCGGDSYVVAVTETCDGLDNDCDGSLMANELTSSTGTEVCGNGIDEDCDGSDESCVISYSWYTGSWGDCSESCGGGTQTRTIYCQDGDSQQVTDGYCSGEGAKPDASQSCNTGDCSTCGELTSFACYAYVGGGAATQGVGSNQQSSAEGCNTFCENFESTCAQWYVGWGGGGYCTCFGNGVADGGAQLGVSVATDCS